MDEKILQLRVGLFVLLAVMILLFLVYINSDVLKGQYTLYLKTISAPGVSTNTPIRKNGVLIGRVQDVISGEEDVTVVLNIYDEVKVYSNEVASIGMDSFLGDAVVEILPLPKKERGEPLQPDQELTRVSVKRNPLEVLDVALNLENKIWDTLDAIEQGGQAVTNFSLKLDTMMGEKGGDLQEAVQQFTLANQRVQAASESLEAFFTELNGYVDDEQVQADIKKTISQLPAITNSIVSTMDATKQTINQVGDSANERLNELRPLTVQLGEQGPQIVDQISERIKNLDALFAGIEDAAQTLKNLRTSKGTVGKLLNDPALYNEALRTMENARVISTKIEPLVNDLRMFADSIARDPGQLGVRGAISNKGQAPKTGYKGIVNSNECRE
ncbi:MAG: MlaD family protein [Planctomycetota bacterium]|nr:MlaD family protein [Planctomycetota bacterium]